MEGVRHGVGALFNAAARNVIKEARKDTEPAAMAKNSILEAKPNRGEITFDAYQAGWNKQSD